MIQKQHEGRRAPQSDDLASGKRRCLRVMGPLTAMKCPSSEPVSKHAAGVGQLGAAQVDLAVAVHAHELKDLLPAGDEAGA